MKKLEVAFFALALTLIVSCGESDKESKSADGKSTAPKSQVAVTPKKPAIPEWDKSISERATLVERLPKDTLLYMRVPNIWGVLSAPKKNSLHAALSNKENQSSIQKLQRGSASLVDAKFGPIAPVVKLLSSNLRSPLEVAVTTADVNNPMSIQVVLSGRFAFSSVDDFNNALQQIVQMHPLAQWIKPADGKTSGQILVGPATLRFSFDEQRQRALIVAGLSVTAEQFVAVQGWKADGSGHPMDAIERRLDAERSGLMVWANVELAAPILMPLVPPHMVVTLNELGILTTRQFGFGFGSADGKGHLLVAAEGDKGVVWELSPPPVAKPAFKTTGAPDIVLAVNIPNHAWIVKLLGEIARQKGVEPQSIEDKINSELVKNAGVELKTLVDGFAGSYFYVFDRNGSYLVQQGGDRIAWDGLVKAMTQKFEITQDTIVVGGETLTHMTIPSLMKKSEAVTADKGMSKELKALIAMYSSMNTHLYWTEEGNTRILSEVPQVLMDRNKFGVDTDLAEWLSSQGLMFEHSLLYLVANIDNVPRINYYAYLRTLNALGDVFEQPMNLTAFPSARELGLPDSGIFSLQIDYADQNLGAALTYESHPAEMFYGAGSAMGGVAVAGVLAAIAIPAYQDYTVRAEVAMAIAKALPLKQRLEVYIQENNSLPDVVTAESFQLRTRDRKLDAIYFDATVGGIVIDFSPSSKAGDQSMIYLIPWRNEQSRLSWRCEAVGTLTVKHLPRTCR